MRINILILLITLSLNISGQTEPLITTPSVSFLDNQLLIDFGITNAKPSDHFYVWLEITCHSGAVLEPKSLSGDIGENIKAGPGKQIIWDLGKDNIRINEEIFVQVKAEKMIKDFNKGTAILLSAAVPGLGQSRVYGGKPVWIAGIAAYGCLVSSVALNRIAYNEYQDYKMITELQDRNELYDKVQSKDKISEICAYTAGGIWLANIIWMAATPNRYHRPAAEANFSIRPTYNEYLNKPQISLTYRF